jgi:YcaO-like protein with predicted kinase domain
MDEIALSFGDSVAVQQIRTSKTFRRGTHRLVAPTETLARVQPFYPDMGLTRIANVTGLDYIGIPVALACRPNSRSLSVAQGKGLDLCSAMASAMMESVESYHAEHIVLPTRFCSYDELRASDPVVDVTRLPVCGPLPAPVSRPLLWIAGVEMFTNQPVWVPYEMVSTNYTLAARAVGGVFQATSNGLASGNHLLEAVSHGICEVVERDATSLWMVCSPAEQAETRVDLSTVDDPDCLEVIAKCRRAGIEVSVWDLTSDIGMPCFRCAVVEGKDSSLLVAHPGAGMGCHPCRAIALLRALMEAAQSRLTYIVGSRDDIFPESYADAQRHVSRERLREQIRDSVPTKDFRAAPNYESSTIADDVLWELDTLRRAGFTSVIVVDLTKVSFGIPVVRIIIPGLEGVSTVPGYVAGPRSQAVLNRMR